MTPRWGAQTELAIANFPVSGRRVPQPVIAALALIKRHAAAVNLELGVGRLDAELAAAIGIAADEVAAGQWDDQFPVDVFQTGSGTSTNMNVNEVIASLAGEQLGRSVHPNDDVNASQSSNDTFPSAVQIAALRRLDEHLVPSVALLARSFALAADRLVDVIKPGRTHLMDAVPISLGAELDAYHAQLAEALERLDACRPRLGRLPLGGTAVGTGLAAPVDFGDRVIERLAQTTGLPLTAAPSRVAAQGSRDALVELSGQLRNLAVALHKIASDIRLMASGPMTGLAEIRLPALQAGSSIMAGKVNPVMTETMAQVCAQVIGHDATVGMAGSLGILELNTFQPLIAANVLESIELLGNACRLFAERCVDGIEADVERARRMARSSPAATTSLVPLLGYDTVAAIVHEAEATGADLVDLAARHLPRAEAERLLDVDALANPHRRP